MAPLLDAIVEHVPPPGMHAQTILVCALSSLSSLLPCQVALYAVVYGLGICSQRPLLACCLMAVECLPPA